MFVSHPERPFELSSGTDDIFTNSLLASILPPVKLCSYVPIDAESFVDAYADIYSPAEKLQFLKRLIILVFHLASLSLAVYFRPADVDAVLLQWPEEITDAVRTAAECITVLGVLNYILVQLGGEMINVGPLSFLKQLVSIANSSFLFPRRANRQGRFTT